MTLQLDTLREYMHDKLDETLQLLRIAPAALASSLCEDDLIPYFPPEFNAVGFDLDRGDIPRQPSQMRLLAWGGFNTASYLKRDCAIAGVESEAFLWIPIAIDRKFSHVARQRRQLAAHAALDEAIDWIESYVANGPRSWVAFELERIGVDDLGLGPGDPHKISNTLELVEDVEHYSGLLLRRWLGTDPEDKGIDELRRFLELMRLQLVSGFATPQLVGYRERWESFDEHPYDGRSEERSGTWIADACMSRRDLEELVMRWPTWVVRAPFLDAPVEHYLEALFTLEPADTTAGAIMSMEALVAPWSGVGKETRDVLCRRAPKVAGRHPGEAMRLEELVGRLYGTVRKGKAHSDPLSKRKESLTKLAYEEGLAGDELAREILEAASRSVLAIHDRLANGETIEDIHKSLDQR